jgi:hypothetical protein
VLVRASGCWGKTDSDAQLATGRRQALAAGGALLSSLLLPGAGSGFGAADAAEPAAVESIYDLSAMQYDEEVSLSKYRGQVRRPCCCGVVEVACPLRAVPAGWRSPSPPQRNAFPNPNQRHPCGLSCALQVLLVVNVASE